MSDSLVFITGATGFIGAQIVQHTLEAGYKVRLSVRRESQIQDLRRVFDSFADKVDYVVVPDYTIPSAFDAALKDVTHVIHVASPLVGGAEDLLTPAVKGTTSVLESALNVPTIKKVVITASVASLIPLGGSYDGVPVKEDIETDKLRFDTSIVPTLEPMGQYQASKLAAHTATLDFVETKKPHFSVVTLHPVFVFGQNLLQTKVDEIAGTNGMLFGSLYSEKPMFAPYRGVHVLDVAEAHVKALTLPEAPVSSFLLSAKDRSWEEALAFAKKEFPGAGFKAEAITGEAWNVDTTLAREKLGFETWREMEEQIRDTVTQQLKLRGM
ncbi:NAD dependent epimerase/dehydratase family protein [Aureobasidium pullulans]|uniref:NAD dependent epimerase/dehydratase family protein n=1 Tax=Aureobasidium pullulans TaxID=5580 RepID=A0A4S9B4D5_AURPU|nr:NAD dependent epimerase/dehydratase family protein [Aureobasidium pullulans]